MTIENCRGFAIGAGERSFTDESAPEKGPRDRTFHVKHLKLEVSFDEENKKVKGTSTLTMSPLNDGLKSVDIDAVDMAVDRVIDGDGRRLDFEVADNKILVKLLRAYKAGQDFLLSITYEAQPRTGLFFIGPDKSYPDKPFQIWTQGESEDNKNWFPCYEAPNDRMTTEVVATVRDRYQAISNGRLAEVRAGPKSGTKTYRWVQEIPHSNYLITLVVGAFDLKEEKYEGVPLQYYVPKGKAKFIPLAFQNTAGMVEFFSRVTGLKYPWAKYAQVVITDFTFGGMENTTCTTLTEYCLHDEHARPNYMSESLVAHELAHQWFGDYITMKSWSHAWLNEGFASYFDPLWFESKFGRDEFHQRMLDTAKGYFAEDSENYRRPIVSNKYAEADDMFDAHTYQKGACVLHMMRYVLGDDLWWKAIRHWVAKRGLSVVETTDFREAIEESTGRALDWFFNEWLYKGGHPDFEVSWSYDDKSKLVSMTVKQKQEAKDITPIFKMPIPVEIATKKRTWREILDVEKAEHTFFIPSPDRPQMVLFDPENWILKTLKFEKQKDELLHQVAHAENIIPRIQACEALAKILSDKAVMDALKKALASDKFWGVRSAAAAALGEMATAEAKEILLSEGLKQQDSRARRAVVDALGNFRGDEEVFERLSAVYRSDKAYYVVSGAAQALGKIRNEKAFDVLTKWMDRPAHADVITRAALMGIADLRDAKGVKVCMDHTAYGKPEMVRMAAATALGKLGFYLEDKKDDIRDHLVRLLNDTNFRTKLGAIAGLVALADGAAIPKLATVEKHDQYGMVRREARKAMRKVQEKQAERTKKADAQKDIETLKDENRDLKARLAKLESKVDVLSGGKRKSK